MDNKIDVKVTLLEKAVFKYERGNVINTQYFSRTVALFPDLNFLRKKITRIFNIVYVKPFTIYWEDSEKDFKSINSDMDLKLVLRKNPDSLIRLYVQLQEKFTTAEVVTFPLDTCNVCDLEIITKGYRCIECYKFNLCDDCEFTGEHNEHLMVRVPQWQQMHGQVNEKIKKWTQL